MSFSDFMNMKKNNCKENEQEKKLATDEGMDQTPELEVVEKKLELLITELHKLGDQKQEQDKKLLEKFKENIDRITKECLAVSKVVGRKNEEIEKNINQNNRKIDTVIAVQVAMLVALYAILCTCLAMAQEIFNFTGFWGVWSIFKLITGLKLLF